MFFFFNKGLSVWRKTVLSTGEETGCWTDATDGQLAGLPTIASGWKWKVEIKGNIANSSAVCTLPIFTESGNEKKIEMLF